MGVGVMGVGVMGCNRCIPLEREFYVHSKQNIIEVGSENQVFGIYMLKNVT